MELHGMDITQVYKFSIIERGKLTSRNLSICIDSRCIF